MVRPIRSLGGLVARPFRVLGALVGLLEDRPGLGLRVLTPGCLLLRQQLGAGLDAVLLGFASLRFLAHHPTVAAGAS